MANPFFQFLDESVVADHALTGIEGSIQAGRAKQGAMRARSPLWLQYANQGKAYLLTQNTTLAVCDSVIRSAQSRMSLFIQPLPFLDFPWIFPRKFGKVFSLIRFTMGGIRDEPSPLGCARLLLVSPGVVTGYGPFTLAAGGIKSSSVASRCAGGEKLRRSRLFLAAFRTNTPVLNEVLHPVYRRPFTEIRRIAGGRTREPITLASA